MIDFEEKQQYGMADLLRIMALLRQPQGGCPWDQVQTHESIRQNFIEETYEAVEAIDLKNAALLREELGDVLLQVVFHCQIEAEQGHFTFDDVCDEICKKLVYRHPHVFKGMEAADPAKALDNWEKMKNTEKSRITAADRLDSVPASLPALMRAAKAQKRASAFGVTPGDKAQVLQALKRKAEGLENQQDAQQAVGDMLLYAVAAARSLGVEPEEALYKATDRFCQRVKACEQQAVQQGLQLQEVEADRLSECWQEGDL